jgi:hypothetical protein
MSDTLSRLADRIDSQAAISARSGQLEDLERIAGELRIERERLHSWAGLMSLLDETYPADLFTGVSGDPGPTIIVLIREVDRLRASLTELVELKDGPRDKHYRAAKDAAWNRAREALKAP